MLLLSLPLPAATINAASCNAPDVESAVNSAVAGDTVTIPGGNCTWTVTAPATAAVTVTAAINLIGTSTTVITDGIDRTGCHDYPALSINVPVQAAWRLSTMTIQGSGPDPGQCAEHIKVETNSHAFRIDHITFTNQQSTGIKIDGDPWGLLDHLDFSGDSKRGVLVQMSNWQQVPPLPAIGWGDNSWAQPDNMGTEQAVYLEDSVSHVTNSSGTGMMGCQIGARCVFRHNTGSFVGTHGIDTNLRGRSSRYVEIYDNTFNDNGTLTANAVKIRGGTLVFFNNAMTGIPGGPGVGSYTSPVSLENYREVDQWSPWGPSTVPNFVGGCDGSGPFDQNGALAASGTAENSSATTDVLTAGGAWTTNQWVGYAIRNTTLRWGASILSSTPNSITTFGATHGTGVHTWNPGDQFEIRQAYPCLDQPGRGQGTYISGGGNLLQPTPIGPLNQVLDPVYAWNNTLNGAAATNVIGAYYTRVQAGRDYYNDTPKPGYTPYVYPHPLQGGAPPPGPCVTPAGYGAAITTCTPTTRRR